MSRQSELAIVASGLAGAGFRLEIQALRAVAVVAVLLYHIWPELLPGGYVGVDVFFVISGYLITGILFKQYVSTGTVSLRDFYVRRIRRLLPAAAVVLMAVALLLPLLPRTQWDDNVSGIVASTLYVQNWWLAAQAIDYLTAESAPSAVQHFWSLSVEEQYYIGWPLMLLMMGLLPAALRRNPGRLFANMVLAVVVLSFGYSVWLTHRDPGLAYFSTLTRAWELGIGGLLAVTSRWRSLSQPQKDALAWIGLVMIAVAVVFFDQATAFPGYAAALPVAGTAFVLIAGDSPRRYSAYAILRLQPFQYLGDISYSLYLWHWPVIVFYSAVSNRTPGVLDGVVLVAVSVALAHQSKALIEDKFRTGQVDTRIAVRSLAIAIGSIALCIASAWMAPRPWLGEAEPGGIAQGGESTPDRLPNPGALVLTHGIAQEASTIVPALSAARTDVPAPYSEKCMSRGSSSELTICEYGVRQADYRVMLVGDAQAAQWQPALEAVASANAWTLDVAVKTDCVLGNAVPARDGKRFEPCEEWRDDLLRYVEATTPDLVIVAQSPTVSLLGGEKGAERTRALARSLQAFAASIGPSTKQLVFVKSVPNLGRRCSDEGDWKACSKRRSMAIRNADPVAEASAAIAGAVLLDMSDAICSEEQCDAVVGDVVVYRAPGHLTATYARSTAAAFARQLARQTGMAVDGPPLAPAEAPADIIQLAIAAKRDNPDLFKDGCHVNLVDSVPRHCVYGDLNSGETVVLVGDSHAGQWLPTLQEIARRRRWKLYSYTKSACAFSETKVTSRDREYTACTEWNLALMEELKQLAPDILITSQSREHKAWGSASREESQTLLAAGLARRWQALQATGARVVVIADTPWMKTNVPDCLTRPGASPAACGTPLAVAERHSDPVLLAAREARDILVVNMNKKICDAQACPAVKDGQVVWRDSHHLTATFARSLAPAFDANIAPSLD